MSSYIQKLERSQTNNPTVHLKCSEKKGTSQKPKSSRLQKKIIKFRAEINEMEKNNRTIVLSIKEQHKESMKQRVVSLKK
jgi:hypothetical protein